MAPPANAGPVYRVLQREGPIITLLRLDAAAVPDAAPHLIDPGQLAAVVEQEERASRAEGEQPRWVWDSTTHWYPGLLEHGVQVSRCWDLRACHSILRHSAWCAASALAKAASSWWDSAPTPAVAPSEADTLFSAQPPSPAVDVVGELRAQLEAVAAAPNPAALRLLLAAESVGTLIAAEIHHAGMPWDIAVHDAVLTELLGPRPMPGARPATMAYLAEGLRRELGAPRLNPDSQPDLLAALRRAGIPATSTSKWELRAYDHPAVELVLAYKKLARLFSANGWAWATRWVADGRFRPEYVVGGVVTGRWATSGGGALQLPAQVRAAVRADPGWVLVVADAAQLEPRILAALSGDEAMAAAGQGADMYQAMVDSGALPSRQVAKVGMLSAMYGGTSGAGGEALPLLRRAFPRAIAYVEAAAAAGERGEVVTTRLGRSCPPPGQGWHETQQRAYEDESDGADQARARRQARAHGRFTRNFVVQGTAAEWAECWLAAVRRRLDELPPGERACRAAEPFARRAHMVYFLHDEVMVHAPAAQAQAVGHILREAAAEAGALLFGTYPVAFPVTVAAVQSYDQAK